MQRVEHHPLHAVRAPRPDSAIPDPFHQFGILRDDYTPTPAYDIFKALIRSVPTPGSVTLVENERSPPAVGPWIDGATAATLQHMAVSVHHIVIDAHDLPAQARFWTQVLDWTVLSEREREIVIGPDVHAEIGICFMPEQKSVKNRVHLDLNAGPDVSPTDREAEIERLIALGARRVDIGQTGEESWAVLADPEDNEFCILRPKRTLIS